MLVDLLILYNQVFWDLVTRSLCVISHIPNLQDEGEMQRPFFAPSRHQVGPDPSPLLSPRALRTGLLSGCSSPIIPLDAKARLLSVFLALRAVPKLCAPTCLFFNSFDLSSLGAGQLLATCFLWGKKPFCSLCSKHWSCLWGQDFLRLLPTLDAFPESRTPPIKSLSPNWSTSAWLFPSSQSQHHPALCGTDTFFSAGVVLFFCLCWVFLRFPSLHPLPRALTFIVCLGKGLRHREELGLGMLPPATKEQSWISWTWDLQSPEALPPRDQATAVIAGGPTLVPHQTPDSSIIAGSGYGSIHLRNRSSHWKPAWLGPDGGKERQSQRSPNVGYTDPPCLCWNSQCCLLEQKMDPQASSNGEVPKCFFALSFLSRLWLINRNFLQWVNRSGSGE